MTKKEFDEICDELELTYSWSPFLNRETIGTMHFTIKDAFYFHFIIDWESQEMSISYALCDALRIGRAKEGKYKLDIANVEELLSCIASFKAYYKPVLTNKLC